MCDLCAELDKELGAFHLHVVVLPSQQGFCCDSIQPTFAPRYTTVNPMEVPWIENGLEAALSYAVHCKCFPSGIKNTEKMNQVPVLLLA